MGGEKKVRIPSAVLIGSLLAIGLATPLRAADLAPPDAAPTTEQYEAMGFYLRGDAGWSFLQWGDSGNAVDVGGGVGYQINPYLRTDVRADWSGSYHVAPGAHLDMTTVLGNLYLDVPTDTMFTPYLGIGAGYGLATVDGGADKSGFTYSLMAGVSIDLSQSVALDAGYRYREIIDSGQDPKDHSVLGGIRFKF
jgi:opacity protein-like surface antigen